MTDFSSCFKSYYALIDVFLFMGAGFFIAGIVYFAQCPMLSAAYYDTEAKETYNYTIVKCDMTTVVLPVYLWFFSSVLLGISATESCFKLRSYNAQND